MSQAQQEIKGITVQESLFQYIVQIARRTRDWPSLSLGVSPRAAVSLMAVAKAVAAMEGRDYLIPDDVKQAAAAYSATSNCAAARSGPGRHYARPGFAGRDPRGRGAEVSGLPAMLPRTVANAARRYGRWGVAFGPRFFLLLLMGVLWLTLAFFELRWAYAMLVWDCAALLAWGVDLLRLPAPSQLKVQRSWHGPPALSVRSEVEIALINGSRIALHAVALDAVPIQLRSAPAELELSVAGGREASKTYAIRPSQRGAVTLGDVYVRYQSIFRIAERWVRVPLEQRVQIYPNLEEAKNQSIFLVRSRQIEMEKRHTRMRGIGREFESLREYREGDEYRDICWTAAARRGKLVTRNYQVERSQTVWIVIDSGRLMRARIGDLTKLDYAVNAALSLAQVALYSGDRVGLLAYGRKLQQRVPAARGSAHLRQMIEQLSTIHEETSEADHLRTAGLLLDGPETAQPGGVADRSGGDGDDSGGGGRGVADDAAAPCSVCRDRAA